MKNCVGIDNSHKSHIWKVEPFGNHLRPDEDMRLAAPKFFQSDIVTAPLLHRVTVHPQDSMLREFGNNFLLQPLRPRTKIPDARHATLRADLRRRLLCAAGVTQDDVAVAMKRQRDVAVRTLDAATATAAPDGRRIPAQVEKQDHLPAVVECRLHRRPQSPPDRMPLRAQRVVSNIDRRRRRHRQSGNPLWQ